MTGMFKNNATACLIRITEEDIRVPDARTLDHQLMVIIRRMPNDKLAIKLKGSARNIQSLVLIRCALQSSQECLGIIFSVIGVRINLTSFPNTRRFLFSHRQVIISNAY